MSFSENIYPYRTNRTEFISRLQRHLELGWTEVVSLASLPVRPGFMLRCRASTQTGTVTCNFSPTDRDKMRINALLSAWARRISDRYLDLEQVRAKESPRYAGESRGLGVPRTSEDASNAIRLNRSQGGAVSFVLNQLERERSGSYPTFFGNGLFENYSLNVYFTTLLRWDDTHCYGLIRELQLQQARYSGAGGSSIHPVWQAARDWIRSNRNRGVYQRYNVRF